MLAGRRHGVPAARGETRCWISDPVGFGAPPSLGGPRQGQREGRREDRSGAASGAGVFWESGGSHGAFPEDAVGDRVAGTGLGAGDRCPVVALCVSAIARVYWWFPALVPAG